MSYSESNELIRRAAQEKNVNPFERKKRERNKARVEQQLTAVRESADRSRQAIESTLLELVSDDPRIRTMEDVEQLATELLEQTNKEGSINSLLANPHLEKQIEKELTTREAETLKQIFSAVSETDDWTDIDWMKQRAKELAVKEGYAQTFEKQWKTFSENSEFLSQLGKGLAKHIKNKHVQEELQRIFGTKNPSQIFQMAGEHGDILSAAIDVESRPSFLFLLQTLFEQDTSAFLERMEQKDSKVLGQLNKFARVEGWTGVYEHFPELRTHILDRVLQLSTASKEHYNSIPTSLTNAKKIMLKIEPQSKKTEMDSKPSNKKPWWKFW